MNHLKSWQYRLLYLAVGALALSGVLWLVVHYLWGAGADNLPHPLEPWMMQLHGAAGFAGLFVAGMLSAAHVPQGWKMTTRSPKLRYRKAIQRRTGLVLCFLGLAGIFSGYLLYYFAPGNIRPMLGWTHAALGLALALLLPLHAWKKAELIHR